MIHVHQINLQKAAGGGEVYTRWFTRALVGAGARVTLYVDRENPFWIGLESDSIRIVGVSSADAIVEHLPPSGTLIVTQSRIPKHLVDFVVSNHVLTGFAHMPILGRSATEFSRYAIVFTVSGYCINLLRQAGISQVYAVPLYGTGEFERNSGRANGAALRANSPYHWDRRKVRDRLLSVLEPLSRSLGRREDFRRKPGVTLGIVSLISPIKQFPALFDMLSPQIARFPQVNVEIFGDGGYAQIRDLRRALAPISEKVRFWGYQKDARAIYPNLDYLLTGLPEKEALGLNVLEAQSLGTPTLAPNAPPFTETVLDQQSGFLYRDPRKDRGEAFGELLDSIVAGRTRPDPRLAVEHLAKFSFAAMVQRTRDLLSYAELRYPMLHETGVTRG